MPEIGIHPYILKFFGSMTTNIHKEKTSLKDSFAKNTAVSRVNIFGT